MREALPAIAGTGIVSEVRSMTAGRVESRTPPQSLRWDAVVAGTGCRRAAGAFGALLFRTFAMGL